MSTKYVFPLPEEQEPIAHQAVAVETHAEKLDTSAAFLRRIPAGVFIAAYGALLVGIVVGAVMLVDHEANAKHSTQAIEPTPPPPPPGPPTNLDDIRASVRPTLITNTAVAPTSTGAALTGTMTQLAEADLANFSGHVSRLLEQTCVDNLAVSSQDNLTIHIWGYCHQSPGQDAIQTYVEAALNNGAASVSIANHPWRPIDQNMTMTWFEDSEKEAEKAIRDSRRIKPVGGVKDVRLIAYGPENVRIRDRYSGTHAFVEPRGQALRDMWGVEPLAERDK